MSRRLSSQLVKRSITASDVLRSIRAVMKYDEDAREAGERSWMMWASGASVTESDYSTSSGQSRAREALAAYRISQQLIKFNPTPYDLRLHLHRISVAATTNHQTEKWNSDDAADHDLLTASWSMTVQEPEAFDEGSTEEAGATADKENRSVTTGNDSEGRK